MEINNIYLLALTLSSIVTAYLAIREARGKRENAVADAMQKLAATLGLTTNELSEALVDGARLRDEIAKLREEIEIHKVKRNEEIASLKASQEKDLEETRKLRNDYAGAQRQIIMQQEQITHHETLIIGLGEYVDTLRGALKTANITVPENGEKELLESVHRLKVTRK